jgi:hypothetical protein
MAFQRRDFRIGQPTGENHVLLVAIVAGLEDFRIGAPDDDQLLVAPAKRVKGADRKGDILVGFQRTDQQEEITPRQCELFP